MTETLNSLADKPSFIISGTCAGADQLGELWARSNNIPIIFCPAYWDLYSKKAAYIRNKRMAEIGDILIAFWDGVSPGTKMMINIMKDLNKPVTIIPYK